MDKQNEAVALAGAHGNEDMGIEAGYCSPERRANQRAIILGHLRRHGSISTLEARLRYFVMSPASRVYELRHQGISIITRRDQRQRCARYHLAGGPDAIE